MSDSLFLPRVVSRERLLFGVIGVVIATLLPTVSAAAQDTPTEQDKERDSQVRIGIYLSGKGVGSDLGLAVVGVGTNYGGGDGDIEHPSHDIMPYPFRFFSIRYNGYQGVFGWAEESGDKYNNERITKFAARYNYYPFKKNWYIYGGPVLWRFKKKFSFKEDVCPTGMIPERCDEETISIDVKTDRPDGKSTTLGINAGFGIEYTLHKTIVFSHEIEFYYSACKRKDFICSGRDLKFLGLHLKF